jgi:hypothetical protein
VTPGETTESEVDDGDYNVETPFNYSVKWKTFNGSEKSAYHQGVWKWETNEEPNEWSQDGHNPSEDIGREYLDIVVSKEPVRMKYKSTPHLVFKANHNNIFKDNNAEHFPVIEIINPSNVNQKSNTRFGGTSDGALKANRWVPCGKP